jgi:hypothetical protein
MLKYPRIAVTASSLTVCGLLIALWVRSYYVPHKFIRLNKSQSVAFGILSDRGGIVIGRFDLGADTQLMLLRQQLMELQFMLSQPGRVPIGRHRDSVTRQAATVQQSVTQYQGKMVTQMMSQRQAVPYWLPLLLAATITATPWIKWRFSLRTLLIVTTLVAVTLAIVVAAI